MQHNVTNNIQQSLEVHFYDGDKFYLVVYQDGIVAYRSEEITERYENTTPSSEWYIMHSYEIFSEINFNKPWCFVQY